MSHVWNTELATLAIWIDYTRPCLEDQQRLEKLATLGMQSSDKTRNIKPSSAPTFPMNTMVQF